MTAEERARCPWAGNDPDYIAYHDTEWGVPLHDDRRLFEFLLLEGLQAGLSWILVLKRRSLYRTLLDNFNPQTIARLSPTDIDTLLANPQVIRNRLKTRALVTNARAFIDVQERCGSFDAYIWRFVEGRPIRNAFSRSEDIPATSPLSIRMSKELKACGFKFVGPTICYAYMQAVGMVNDHLIHCFRYQEIESRA